MGNLASSFAGCVENVGASVSDLFVYSSIVAIFISIKLSICLSINRDLSIVIYLSIVTTSKQQATSPFFDNSLAYGLLVLLVEIGRD